MKKSSKLALAALAVGLFPFDLKMGEDGKFSYQSLLVGISSKKREDGKRDLVLSLFNLPDSLKKKPTDAPEAAPEAAPAEAPEEPQAEPEEVPEISKEPTPETTNSSMS